MRLYEMLRAGRESCFYISQILYKVTARTRTGWDKEEVMNLKPFLMPDGEGSGAESIDDLLKDKEYQSELDRRINQAVQTATAKERDRQKIIQDKMADEMLRVSKMTEDEKEAYFKNKAEKEAAKKEADLTRRELMLDARTALADKNLPDSFVDLLSYTDKDACMKSIDTLDMAFQKAVQTAVNEKLKGSAPPADARSEGTSSESEKEMILAQMRKQAGIRKK